MTSAHLNYREKVIYSLVAAFVLFGTCLDFFNIARGTGTWHYGFSHTWALIFIVYCILIFLVFLGSIFVVWRDSRFILFSAQLIGVRRRIANFRWMIAIGILLFPVCFFQFTVLGVVFHGFFIRLLIGLLSLLLFSILISEGDQVISWYRFLSAIVLMAAIFAVAAAFRFVSNYPFALGWSEGNRLWDYSIMFGHDRYIYPIDREIPVALDPGRQFIGGLPFLIPGVTIEILRLWVGLTGILPYLLFGLALFRFFWKDKRIFVLLVLWLYIFLIQGPIHPPLVLSAVLVVLAWRSPLWVSVPLIVASAGFASVSRYTWTFAPTMWLLLLELSDVAYKTGGRIPKASWVRMAILTLAGLAGGVLLPILFDPSKTELLQAGDFGQASNVAPENLQEKISDQPLFWYRLLPNPTYKPGILLGLLMAAGPLVLLIGHLACRKIWSIGWLQKIMTVSVLLAFFVVGLIVSTKIGGGGDLHNMDMFLIGLALTAAIIWEQGGRDWLKSSARETLGVKLVLVALLTIPGIKPLLEMRAYDYGDKASWLMALTNARNEKALDMHASQAAVDDALQIIQNESNNALKNGEVLFIDQRQLLTFGYVTGIPLVPEYDKKILIERSFSKNRAYFSEFYSDLEAHRFSLIIVQPLSAPKKGSNEQFGEENNSWVKWAARPLLCYYEIQQTLTDVNVQLLTPSFEVVDCSMELP